MDVSTGGERISTTGSITTIDGNEEKEIKSKIPFGFQAAAKVNRLPDPEVTSCASCGSREIGWDIALGYTCNNCGRTDADE